MVEVNKRELLEGAALLIKIVAREDEYSPVKLYSDERIDISMLRSSLNDLLSNETE